MTDHDIVHFYTSEEIFDKAAEVFTREKELLEGLISGSGVDIQHVGSCAIPGAMGKFDIDIQIRVPKEYFDHVLVSCKKQYLEKHPELWTPEFAIFMNPDTSVDIDYLVTVKDSIYDDFYWSRDYLISHPEKLQEYNELKMKFEGKPYHEYRTAKQEFFGGNGKVKFLKDKKA